MKTSDVFGPPKKRKKASYGQWSRAGQAKTGHRFWINPKKAIDNRTMDCTYCGKSQFVVESKLCRGNRG